MTISLMLVWRFFLSQLWREQKGVRDRRYLSAFCFDDFLQETTTPSPGNANRTGRRLGTVDLLARAACFLKNTGFK